MADLMLVLDAERHLVPLPDGLDPARVSVQTTYWGSRPELADVLDLAARGLLTPEVTTYSLDDAVGVYRALAAGRLRGRAVIVP
jgi:propanol-preferring alcohol dehydrogenase